LNGPEQARLIAIEAAEQDDDLAALLPTLLRATRKRADIEGAIKLLNRELARRPRDPLLRRARAMLVGALHTTAYPRER
jgi:hypothetical protein